MRHRIHNSQNDRATQSQILKTQKSMEQRLSLHIRTKSAQSEIIYYKFCHREKKMFFFSLLSLLCFGTSLRRLYRKMLFIYSFVDMICVNRFTFHIYTCAQTQSRRSCWQQAAASPRVSYCYYFGCECFSAAHSTQTQRWRQAGGRTGEIQQRPSIKLISHSHSLVVYRQSIRAVRHNPTRNAPIADRTAFHCVARNSFYIRTFFCFSFALLSFCVVRWVALLFRLHFILIHATVYYLQYLSHS